MGQELTNSPSGKAELSASEGIELRSNTLGTDEVPVGTRPWLNKLSSLGDYGDGYLEPRYASRQFCTLARRRIGRKPPAPLFIHA